MSYLILKTLLINKDFPFVLGNHPVDLIALLPDDVLWKD